MDPLVGGPAGSLVFFLLPGDPLGLGLGWPGPLNPHPPGPQSVSILKLMVESSVPPPNKPHHPHPSRPGVFFHGQISPYHSGILFSALFGVSLPKVQGVSPKNWCGFSTW